MLTYLAATVRLPDRVALPTLFSVGIAVTSVIPLVQPRPEHAGRISLVNRRPVSTVIGLMLVVVSFIIASPYRPARISGLNDARRLQTRQDAAALTKIDQHGQFLCTGSAVTVDGFEVFSTTSSYAGSNVTCTGWMMRSPIFENRLSDRGFGSDPLRALLDDDHKFLVTDTSLAAVFERLYARDSSQAVRLEPVGEVAIGRVYRVVSVDQGMPDGLGTKLSGFC